jgi:hypothetical protein
MARCPQPYHRVSGESRRDYVEETRGHVIGPFAFTLIIGFIGFITGTYSSIYIAAPVVHFRRQARLLAADMELFAAEFLHIARGYLL